MSTTATTAAPTAPEYQIEWHDHENPYWLVAYMPSGRTIILGKHYSRDGAEKNLRNRAA